MENLDVTLVESADQVGGRLRTERAAAFLLDRGFRAIDPVDRAPRVAVGVDRLRRLPAGRRVLADDGPRAVLGSREPAGA